MTKNKLIVLIFAINLMLSSAILAQTNTWHFKSDETQTDLKNNTTIYLGNVVIFDNFRKLSGDKILLKSTPQSKDKQTYSEFEIFGSPAHIEQKDSLSQSIEQLSATSIRYNINENKITAKENIHLIKHQSAQQSFEVKGNILTILQQPTYQLNVTGNPLTLNIAQIDGEPIVITADHLTYSEANNLIKLNGNIVMLRDNAKASAHQLSYNLQTQILQMSKFPDKQIEIIQSTQN
ncbi:LptA/OstA family protein [Aliikangiella maris]|uniref:LptA/OstA family protein n=2 Tax=Aliikangiella maris TaxID=3162458 RepID=A0ABV2BV17_9GAMM